MKVRYLFLPALVLMASGGPLFATGEAEMAAAGEVQEVDWVIHSTAFSYDNPELDLWELVAEVANLRVNPIALSNDVAVDKINVLIASRDLPDMISHGSAFRQLNLVAPSGPFVNVGENLDKVPNLKRYVDKYGWDLLGEVTADDGELYNFPAVNTWEEGVFRSGRAILFREDLLTAMEPEEIKTVADLERAFLDILENHGKPILSMRDMATGSTAFDLLPRIMGTSVQDVPWWNPATEQFENQYATRAELTREAVELMARWYELGIIHPEFAAQPDRVWEGMLMAGDLVVEFEHSGRLIVDTQTVQQIDPSFGFTIIPRPTYQGVQAPLRAVFNPFRSSRNTFVAASSEAIDNIFVLFNDMYDIDKEPRWRLGPVEGLHYVVRGDGTFAFPFTRHEINNNEHLDMYGGGILDWMRNESGIGYEEFFRLRTDQTQLETRFYTNAELRPLLDYIAAVEATGIETYFPPTPKYGDQSGLAADIKNNVQTYILENYIKFINGTKPLDEWDSFVDGLDSLRYGQLVDLSNAAVQ